MAKQSNFKQTAAPYPSYGICINVVELCARLQAYDITKPQIEAFSSTPRSRYLPLEVTQAICNELFYGSYNAKRPYWQDMSACAQNKCGVWHHLPAQVRHSNFGLERWQAEQPRPDPELGERALQDYQMQLMLLEQLNKRRLLASRAHSQSLNAQLEQLKVFARSMVV